MGTGAATIAVLMATHNREELLSRRSLPALAAQCAVPDLLVIVNDGDPLGTASRTAIQAVPVRRGAFVLTNTRTPGVAGAWNTGLAFLWERGHRGYVAILDDDDEWNADHLQVNAATVAATGAGISVSGLRMFVNGAEQPREPIRVLSDREFLVGNPGWQGSNTFVRLPLLREVGGFREGLASLHDRDLAIRLLRHREGRWSLTGRWTASWHLDTQGSLSSPGSPAKLSGLQRFWQLYGPEMTADEAARFFSRSERLFGFDRGSILRDGSERSSEPNVWGE